jgi:hypothetical protein
MSSTITIPVVGDIPVKYIIIISITIVAVISTIIYAFLFTSKQQSDIPTTYGTVRRNKDINDTMTELLGKNWVSVVIVFYIMTIIIFACLYTLNICAQIEYNVSDPISTKYTILGVYGLIAVISVISLVQAGWYYVNDYNFVIDTPVIEYDYQREKRTEQVANTAIIMGVLIFVVITSAFVYNYYNKK